MYNFMYEKFGMRKNVVPLQAKRKNVTIMTSSTTIQGVYVNVPAVDWSLFRELPLNAIASFLNVTPTYLSKIRQGNHLRKRKISILSF
jgi:hypothetical protein